MESKLPNRRWTSRKERLNWLVQRAGVAFQRAIKENKSKICLDILCARHRKLLKVSFDEWVEPERSIVIAQMPGGSHYYLHDSHETSEWPSTKFETFDEAWEEALKRVPKNKITVKNVKIKRKVEGD